MMTEGEEVKRDGDYKRSDINLDCRFYSKKFPEEGDYVKVRVREVVDNGAYVSLLEYNEIEGMITTSEFTTMRLRSFQKVIKEGKQETVLVLRVDTEKGYIDLSKKKVNAEEMKEFEENYSKAKTVNTILRTVADKVNMDLEKVYEQTAWPLTEKFDHAYDAFKVSLIEPDKVWEGLTVDEKIKTVLTAEIKRRLAPNEVKIKADFELTCYSFDGIECIKEALRAGEQFSNDVIHLKFQYDTAPLYAAWTSTLEKSQGIEKMTEALEAIEATIKKKGGSFKLRSAPKVFGDKGQDIKEILKAVEQKNYSDDEEEDNDEAMNVDVEGDEEGEVAN